MNGFKQKKSSINCDKITRQVCKKAMKVEEAKHTDEILLLELLQERLECLNVIGKAGFWW